MEASSETVLPSPQPTDSSEVVEALSAAVNLWPTDPREALRALRRAAESAADAGDDARSLELAKAAAELRSSANLGTSMAPGAAPMVLLSPVSAFQSPGFQTSSLPVAGASTAVAPDVAGFIPTPTATQPGIGVPAEAASIDAAVGASTESAPKDASDEPRASDPTLQDRPTPPNGMPAQSQSAPVAAVPADVIHAGLFAITTHDPGQTVPATPAASAAAAVHVNTGYATVTAAPAMMGGAGGSSNGLSASSASLLGSAAIAAQHPTPVEVPAARRPSWDPSRRPVSPPAGFPAMGRPLELGLGALIEHRALRVGVSQTVNAAGNFEFVVLREGAPLPSGWRECLLVALDSNQMLVPVA